MALEFEVLPVAKLVDLVIELDDVIIQGSWADELRQAKWHI